MKIRKNDQVIIISGKDKNFKGKVIEVKKGSSSVVVDGANLIKKHLKGPSGKKKGQRIEMPAPLHVSNVQLFCEKCKKGVRVSYIEDKEKGKKRICKKCKNEI